MKFTTLTLNVSNTFTISDSSSTVQSEHRAQAPCQTPDKHFHAHFLPRFLTTTLRGWQGSNLGACFKDEAIEAQKGDFATCTLLEILHSLSFLCSHLPHRGVPSSPWGRPVFCWGAGSASPSRVSHLTSAGHLTDATCPAIPPAQGCQEGNGWEVTAKSTQGPSP